MELSRKEEYRNKKVSIGVTALAFLVMVAFLIFKNIITTSADLIGSTANEISIGISSENNIDPNKEQKSIAPVSNTNEKSADQKIITDANSEINIESSARTMANKYKRIAISNIHQTTSTENSLPASVSETGSETSTTKTSGDSKLGFDLEKRSLITSPLFGNDTKEEGKVIVEITVDKDGNVIEANPNGRGTTTSNTTLKAKAKKIAEATKFSPNQKIEEQRGSITIIFSFN